VKTEDIASCEALTFSIHVAVSNHGSMDGSHAVLLFARSKSSVPGFPIKQPVGFERVHTAAGNPEGKRVLLLGAHVLTVGDEEFELFIEL